MKTRTNKTDHYQTLDVAPTATAQEIKRAYRKKAARVHPDKQSGSHEAMTALTVAYRVLGDEQRRARYDATGDDSQQSIDQMVAATISQAFLDALQNEVPDAVGHAQKYVKSGQVKIKRELEEAKRQCEKLCKRRDKVSVSEGVNLYHALIDQQLSAANQAMAKMRSDIEGLDRVLVELQRYRNEGVVVPEFTWNEIASATPFRWGGNRW